MLCRYGCMDNTATNFNAQATLPIQCAYPIKGCTNSNAENYLPTAEVLHPPEVCVFAGCMDSTRPNFDPLATADNGRCDPLFPGCTDPSAENYNAAYNKNDGTCSFAGCTIPGRTNCEPPHAPPPDLTYFHAL